MALITSDSPAQVRDFAGRIHALSHLPRVLQLHQGECFVVHVAHVDCNPIGWP